MESHSTTGGERSSALLVGEPEKEEWKSGPGEGIVFSRDVSLAHPSRQVDCGLHHLGWCSGVRDGNVWFRPSQEPPSTTSRLWRNGCAARARVRKWSTVSKSLPSPSLPPLPGVGQRGVGGRDAPASPRTCNALFWNVTWHCKSESEAARGDLWRGGCPSVRAVREHSPTAAVRIRIRYGKGAKFRGSHAVGARRSQRRLGGGMLPSALLVIPSALAAG